MQVMEDHIFWSIIGQSGNLFELSMSRDDRVQLIIARHFGYSCGMEFKNKSCEPYDCYLSIDVECLDRLGPSCRSFGGGSAEMVVVRDRVYLSC